MPPTYMLTSHTFMSHNIHIYIISDTHICNTYMMIDIQKTKQNTHHTQYILHNTYYFSIYLLLLISVHTQPTTVFLVISQKNE